MSTQQDLSIGLGKETVYGTPVPAQTFLEFTNEKLTYAPSFYQGKGLRPRSQVARGSRRGITQVKAEGSIELEATTKGLGTLLAAAFGLSTSAAIPNQTGAYQQVHTLDKDDWHPSYTIQKGIPLLGGAIQASTFIGAQCGSIKISAKKGDAVQVETEWVSKDVRNDVAYASPSYAVGADIFTFVHGAITLGGTITPPTATALASGGTAVATITEWDIEVKRNLDDNGWNLGSGTGRARPAALGLTEITGSMKAEYSDNVLRDAYLANTPLSMVLTFAHPSRIGASTINPTLQVVVPQIRLEGDFPTSNGGDVIELDCKYVGLHDEVNEPIYVAYRTSDTAI